MKSISKKLIVLSIVFSMLMVTFMPLIAMAYDPATASSSEVATSTSTGELVFDNVVPTNVASVNEVVDPDTNMVEYINTKRAEFVSLIQDLGIDESVYNDLFVAEGGIYKYIKIASADDFKLEGTTLKLNYTEVTVTNYVEPTTIDTLNVKIKSPKVGDSATATTKPTITLEDDANCIVEYSAYITAYPSEIEEGYDEPFVGTFESDKDYYVEVSLLAKDGYVFTDNDNMTLKVNGKTTNYEMNNWNADGSQYYMFYAKVSATSEEEVAVEDENTYEFIEGADQTYIVGNGESARFRIDANFALFEVGGAVYVDEELVDEDNYKAYSGSTVIELNEDYVSTLDEGEHTLRVAFNNGEESTTTFIVEGKETKSSNAPKTGDTIIIWAALIVASILGIALTVKLSKKNK